MKIKKFKIKNYRAIEEIELNLSFSINPIIGVNESGKTSVLKAVLAFDKNRDRFNNGEHLDFQNKYSTKSTKGCVISAVLFLDKNELELLVSATKLTTDHDDYQTVKSYNTKTEFILSRSLSPDGHNYHFDNEILSDATRDRIKKYLVDHLPFILYFDDFSDRVPDEIEFPADYPNTGKLTRSKLRDWQEIIEEIFKRADTEGIDDNEIPLQSYMNISNSDRKSDVLSDIEGELNKEIMTEWKRIKQSGKSLADDSEKLNLVIVNEKGKFEFKVRDKSNQDKRRTFNIGERSKGFQWFFNYMIKLKFNPNYKTKLENSIFLLDEPGSYLHSAAQVELLNELQRVSQKNTIIYCTHSQYLLNPEVIKLGSIKIAEKSQSRINLQEYGSYSGKRDKSALSPIYQALQLNFAHDFLGKIVITEGITDYYLFNILQKQTLNIDEKIIDEKIKFIPSSGASQSSTLISLAISFSDNFVVFLDNDNAGKKALKKYSKEFGESISKSLFVYQKPKEKFVLENYLSKSDRKRLLEITNSKDLKRALGFLYYDYKEKQTEFVENLNKETLDNLFECFDRLKQLVEVSD
jgi:predicted ATP-dependent endonuclease of OLD family